MRGPVRLGRFLLSRGEGAPLRYLFRCLWPPHGRRERWLRPLAARSGRLAGVAVGPAEGDGGSTAAARVLERLRAAPPAGLEAAAREGDWLLAGPGAEDRRGRWTAWLFPPRSAPGEEAPDRVVKLRREGGPGAGLAAEAAALDRLRDVLPEPLRATLPAVLGRGRVAGEEAAGWEVLVLAALPGRSAYVELQAAFARGGLPARHLPPAAAWLARFHRATLLPGEPWRPPPWEELAPPGEGSPPDWYRRLAAELDDGPWPRAAGHGDFWARNVLFHDGRTGARGAGLAGVVDWEDCRDAAPPFEDLFHFAWSYGRSFPWRGRRRGADEAFARTFLRETGVSRGVRRYLTVYARESGMDSGVLGDLFRAYLLTRGEDRETWLRLYRRLEGAGRSVFSG